MTPRARSAWWVFGVVAGGSAIIAGVAALASRTLSAVSGGATTPVGGTRTTPSATTTAPTTAAPTTAAPTTPAPTGPTVPSGTLTEQAQPFHLLYGYLYLTEMPPQSSAATAAAYAQQIHAHHPNLNVEQSWEAGSVPGGWPTSDASTWKFQFKYGSLPNIQFNTTPPANTPAPITVPAVSGQRLWGFQ